MSLSRAARLGIFLVILGNNLAVGECQKKIKLIIIIISLYRPTAGYKKTNLAWHRHWPKKISLGNCMYIFIYKDFS